MLAAVGLGALWSSLTRSTPERTVENYLLGLATHDTQRVRATLCREAREALDAEPDAAGLLPDPLPAGKQPSYHLKRLEQHDDRALVRAVLDMQKPYQPTLEVRFAMVREDGAWKLDPVRTWEESAQALAPLTKPALQRMRPELRERLPQELRHPAEKKQTTSRP